MAEGSKSGGLMNHTARQVSVVVSFIGVVVVNWLASSGVFNGTTPKEISDKYPTLITPASWTFSIWGLIYAFLAIYTIYQALPSQRTNGCCVASGWLFVLSNILNAAWVIVFQYDIIAATIIIMAALLITLAFINIRIDRHRANSSWLDYFAVHVAFEIYLAWIIVATLVNLSVVFYTFGVRNDGEVIASAILLIIAGIVALYGLFSTRAAPKFVYGLVFIWAFLGIWAGALDRSGTIAIIALVLAIVTALGEVAAAVVAWRARKGRSSSTAGTAPAV